MSKLRNEMALSKEIEIEETDVVAQYAQKYASFMTSTPGLERSTRSWTLVV